MKKGTRCISFVCILCLLTALCGCEKIAKSAEKTMSPAVFYQPALAKEVENLFPETGSEFLESIDSSLPAVSGVTLPQSSAEFSLPLAKELLTLCSGYTAEKARELFSAAGFETLMQKDFDKPEEDPSHTCAYSVGKKQMTVSGVSRTVFLIAIRGTRGGEWYSNFDFAPSRSGDTVFAENFLFSAEAVFLELQSLLKSTQDPILLVCGHSRGAACANLLGVLLDEIYSEQNLFVYTFATPATVRAQAAERTYPNIFNFINPCDLVPRMPLTAWGYERAGTDIFLPGNAQAEAELKDIEETLSSLAPDIPSYYNITHSLEEAGPSENGLSAFDVMLAFGSLLTKAGIAETDGKEPEPADFSLLSGISEESDFKPLFDLLKEMTEKDGEGAQKLLMQHLPLCYMNLLYALTAEEGEQYGLH